MWSYFNSIYDKEPKYQWEGETLSAEVQFLKGRTSFAATKISTTVCAMQGKMRSKPSEENKTTRILGLQLFHGCVRLMTYMIFQQK